MWTFVNKLFELTPILTYHNYIIQCYTIVRNYLLAILQSKLLCVSYLLLRRLWIKSNQVISFRKINSLYLHVHVHLSLALKIFCFLPCPIVSGAGLHGSVILNHLFCVPASLVDKLCCFCALQERVLPLSDLSDQTFWMVQIFPVHHMFLISYFLCIYTHYC